MNRPTQVAPGPIYRGRKPVRNEAYKRFIRSIPCVVCLKYGQIEACHTGPHGTGQKSSDLSCIPLCHTHHRASDDSLHKLGPVRFQEHHRLEFADLTTLFQELYEKKMKRRAA
jgi:hypothetical protein